MTAPDSPRSAHVVIVGGGVAGLEALLALQALAGDRVDLTLVSQRDSFIDRPMTVAEPFGLASAPRHSLSELVAERGATSGGSGCAWSARRIGLWRCSAIRAAGAPPACWSRRGSSSSARAA